MGDDNVGLFKSKFDLLKGQYPLLTGLCNAALITSTNRHIFNSTNLESHHALIPLSSLPVNVPEVERKVWGLVLEAFFMVCMPDFVYDEKQLLFHAGDYTFKAAVRSVVQKGWKEAARKEEIKDTEVQEALNFNEKRCSIASTRLLEKKTQPPKEFSMDSLLGFMENPRNEDGDKKLCGLGTPATRAEIIKTLFGRSYIVEEKKKLYATNKGNFLLRELAKDKGTALLADVATTTAWEEQLENNPLAFEASIIAYIKSCVAQKERCEVFQGTAMGTCPACGRGIRESAKSFYCPGYKETPRCGFSVWKEVCGARISVIDVKSMLEGRKTRIKNCISKEGKKFKASFYLKDDHSVGFAFAKA
jgi:DNA topoisomerase-3